MSDDPQEMTIEGAGLLWLWQRNLVDSQLNGELLVDKADVHRRVNGGEGIGTPCQQELDVE